MNMRHTNHTNNSSSGSNNTCHNPSQQLLLLTNTQLPARLPACQHSMSACLQAARQLGVGRKALYDLALQVWSH